MRECQSSRLNGSQHLPAKCFAEFLCLLLVCRDIHHLATRASYIHIEGVESGCFFQLKQREIVSTLVSYAQQTWLGYSTRGFDYHIIEQLAGRYIRNPLIYGDRELLERLFSCFHHQITVRLLVQIPEFLETSAEIDSDTTNWEFELEFKDYNNLWATVHCTGSRRIQFPNFNITKIDSIELQGEGDEVTELELRELKEMLGNGWLVHDFISDDANFGEDLTCCIINTERLLVQEVWVDDEFLFEGREAIDESVRDTYGLIICEDGLWKQVDAQRNPP
jgi:hypothetical protein